MPKRETAIAGDGNRLPLRYRIRVAVNANDMRAISQNAFRIPARAKCAVNDGLAGLCRDSGNNLVKPDRMGMAVSIEARTPFLDYRMMEFAFRSRGATKLSSQGDKKHWFKKAAAPLIGNDLAHRKKQMFTVPVGDWFKGASYPWLKNTLQNSELLARLFIGPEIDLMLERHRSGAANYTRELRALAALALWHEGARGG